MKKEKTILIFSDLEGTILRENDGDYSTKDMQNFLFQLDMLQQLTDANVHLHLVSPIYKKNMEILMNRIDYDIIRYNRTNITHDDIPEIESATYTPETNIIQEDFLEDRLVPLKKTRSSKVIDTSAYGKLSYVKSWCEYYDSKDKLIMAIYCGNDFNDIDAMEFIRRQKCGCVICPSNSKPEASQKAAYVSDKTDLKGITDGILLINERIAQRVLPKRKKDARTIDD